MLSSSRPDNPSEEFYREISCINLVWHFFCHELDLGFFDILWTKCTCMYLHDHLKVISKFNSSEVLVHIISACLHKARVLNIIQRIYVSPLQYFDPFHPLRISQGSHFRSAPYLVLTLGAISPPYKTLQLAVIAVSFVLRADWLIVASTSCFAFASFDNRLR